MNCIRLIVSCYFSYWFCAFCFWCLNCYICIHPGQTAEIFVEDSKNENVIPFTELGLLMSSSSCYFLSNVWFKWMITMVLFMCLYQVIQHFIFLWSFWLYVNMHLVCILVDSMWILWNTWSYVSFREISFPK